MVRRVLSNSAQWWCNHKEPLLSCLMVLLSANLIRLCLPGTRTGMYLPATPITYPGKPIPYAVTLKLVRAAGNRELRSEIQYAVRADGSQMISEYRDGRLRAQTLYLSRGDKIVAVSDRRMKCTYPHALSGPGDWVRDPRSKCMLSISGKGLSSPGEWGGEQVVSGYRAARIKSGNVTTWYALDYGCANIGSRTIISGGTAQSSAISLRRGEPPGAVFDLSGYREVLPSVLLGPELCDNGAMKERLRQMDKDYTSANRETEVK